MCLCLCVVHCLALGGGRGGERACLKLLCLDLNVSLVQVLVVQLELLFQAKGHS